MRGTFHCDTRDFIIDAHERGEEAAEIAASLHLTAAYVTKVVNDYVHGQDADEQAPQFEEASA